MRLKDADILQSIMKKINLIFKERERINKRKCDKLDEFKESSLVAATVRGRSLVSTCHFTVVSDSSKIDII